MIIIFGILAARLYEGSRAKSVLARGNANQTRTRVKQVVTRQQLKRETCHTPVIYAFVPFCADKDLGCTVLTRLNIYISQWGLSTFWKFSQGNDVPFVK